MNVTSKAANMSSQHERQDERLTGQRASNQAGHCLLTSHYFEPCTGLIVS